MDTKETIDNLKFELIKSTLRGLYNEDGFDAIEHLIKCYLKDEDVLEFPNFAFTIREALIDAKSEDKIKFNALVKIGLENLILKLTNMLSFSYSEE